MTEKVSPTGLPRRRLTGHVLRGAGMLSGFPAMFLGIPFLGFGGIFLLMVAGIIPAGGNDKPNLIVGALAAVFAGVGLWLFLHGAVTKIKSLISDYRYRRHPDEPWIWDHRWNPRMARTKEGRSILLGFLFVLLFACFLLPFNWWAFGSPFSWLPASNECSNPVVVVVIIPFDLVWLFCIGYMVYALVRYIKYGNSRLHFSSFPFYLGGELRATLSRVGRLRRARTLTIRLVCVEETFETREKNRSAGMCYALYEDKQVLTAKELREIQGRTLPVAFPLPFYPPATRLTARPSYYWEVVVTADIKGIDYEAVFLVPVYDRREEHRDS